MALRSAIRSGKVAQQVITRRRVGKPTISNLVLNAVVLANARLELRSDQTLKVRIGGNEWKQIPG